MEEREEGRRGREGGREGGRGGRERGEEGGREGEERREGEGGREGKIKDIPFADLEFSRDSPSVSQKCPLSSCTTCTHDVG